MLSKCDIDARVSAQRIGKLDAARWQFLDHLLAARLRRLQHVQPYMDCLHTSFAVHRSYDAAVCYRFYQFGLYTREVSRYHFSGFAVTQRSLQQYRLHGPSNKYSCYHSQLGLDSDSDTDMED